MLTLTEVSVSHLQKEDLLPPVTAHSCGLSSAFMWDPYELGRGWKGGVLITMIVIKYS